MKQRKNFLLLAPIVVLGVYWVFVLLHHGVTPARRVGFNTQLPQAVNGRGLLNKKLQYEQAERDSLRKAQFERQDPYRRDSGVMSKPAVVYSGRPAAVAPLMPATSVDPRAEQVLEQLRQLQRVIHTPLAQPTLSQPLPSGFTRSGYAPVRVRPEEIGDTVGDARVGQLNAMLDKVIRIQHPQEVGQKATIGIVTDEVLPADSSDNVIAAVVASDQTLVGGTTIALRITDSIRVDGRVWPAGQLIYGTVAITNDRMLVHVSSLREDRSLFVVDLQVYDLDGIAGIHIPGVLSRDVAKQSADQGVSSLNVLEADPSLGAQAANAGIQTVKTFVGRKVRQVRVDVRAGYQVLLREEHPKVSNRIGPRVISGGDTVAAPPDLMPGGPVIAHCGVEGVRLRLRGIWLADGRLWLGLEWTNNSPIVYAPAYARWYIRDRRRVRRTAMQEVSLEPLRSGGPVVVPSDSLVHSWTGFAPFALARDKELVLEVAEKGGGRVLELVIKHQELLKAKNYVRKAGEGTETAGDRAL